MLGLRQCWSGNSVCVCEDIKVAFWNWEFWDWELILTEIRNVMRQPKGKCAVLQEHFKCTCERESCMNLTQYLNALVLTASCYDKLGSFMWKSCVIIKMSSRHKQIIIWGGIGLPTYSLLNRLHHCMFLPLKNVSLGFSFSWDFGVSRCLLDV